MAVTYQTTVSGQSVMVHLPRWQAKDATGLRPVICQHGVGGQSIQIAQGMAFAGHPEFLADRGHVVACISTGDSYANPTCMSYLTALYTFLTSTLLASGTKVGILGWSMGGLNVLRWLVENPTLVAVGYLFNPLTDLDWWHAQPAWTAGVDAAYASDYTASGSPRSPLNTASAFRGGPRVRIVHATDDPTVPYSQSTGFVSAVNDAAVDLRAPDVTGGHQGGLLNTPHSEVWEFLRTHWVA